MRFFLFLPFIFFTACHPSTSKLNQTTMTSDQTSVQQTVTEFLAAGDAQDVGRLEAVMDPTYRVTINQFMGGEGVTVIDRAGYLGMIAAGKLGGKPRSVTFSSIEVVGNVAHVRAMLASDELNFDSHFTLAKDKVGVWMVVTDAPFVTPKG